MIERKYKNCLYIYIVIIGICAALAAAYYLGSRNSATSTEIHDSTDRAMAGIKDEIQSAGGEITAGAGHADAAGSALERADELLDRSEGAAKNQSAGIKRVQAILRECQKLNDEIRSGLQRADGEVGDRATAGSQG